MLTYLRYALATVCFAASVGCLALWWRSRTHFDRMRAIRHDVLVMVTSFRGSGDVKISRDDRYAGEPYRWGIGTVYVGQRDTTSDKPHSARSQFTAGQNTITFPLWYAALIFALSGVASLRLGRRFTLRSAIIATTVVAALLGMAVIL